MTNDNNNLKILFIYLDSLHPLSPEWGRDRGLERMSSGLHNWVWSWPGAWTHDPEIMTGVAIKSQILKPPEPPRLPKDKNNLKLVFTEHTGWMKNRIILAANSMINWDALIMYGKTCRHGNDCHKGRNLLCSQIPRSRKHISHAGPHGGGGSMEWMWAREGSRRGRFRTQ